MGLGPIVLGLCDPCDFELCFVGQDCQRIPGILGATYGLQTKRLDLSFNAIKSVKGLEKFPYLEELILDNNCIDDSVIIPRLDTLHTLSLNKNKLSNLPKLVEQVRRQLPNLRYLSLLGNAACPDMLSPSHTREEDYAAYRLYVLQHLPRLRFLDSTAVRRSEVRQARRARMGCAATITTVSTPKETASSRTATCSGTPSPAPSSAPPSPASKSPAKTPSVSRRSSPMTLRPQTLGVKSSTSVPKSPAVSRRRGSGRGGGAATPTRGQDWKDPPKMPTILVKTPSGSSLSLTPSLSPSTGEVKSSASSPATPHKSTPSRKDSTTPAPHTPTPPPPPPSPSSGALKGSGSGGDGDDGDKPSGFLKVRQSWRSFFKSSSVVPPQA